MATAAFTIVSIAAQQKGRKEQKRANRVQARSAEIENAAERRRAIAEGNKLRAQTIAQGTNQGVGGGSSTAGAAGSVISQTASNVGNSQVSEGFDQASFRFNSKANQYFNNARTFQALGETVPTFLPKRFQ